MMIRSTSWACAGLLAAALLLGGCQHTVVNSTSLPGTESPTGSNNPAGANGRTGDSSRVNSSGDLVTSSDEPANTRRAKLRLELATAYFGRGQLPVALDEVKLALQADPKLAEAQNLRGLIYSGMGDPKLAEESFKRALELSPRDPDTLHNYGWFMCQQNRFREADDLFEQALKVPLYRGVTGTLRAQGVCQARAGDLARAETTLSRSYELDPGSPATAVNLSEVLLRNGKYPRARFIMQRVNGVPQYTSAQTLWLAMRIEERMGNAQGVTELGFQLRNRYPDSTEARAYEQGNFQ